MYGKLTVVTGSMFAGKTTYLIKMAEKLGDSDDLVVFKPAMDIRYSTTHCVSHNGEKIQAVAASTPDDLVFGEKAKLVCFDEIQFFNPPHFTGDITRAIKVFLRAGKDVLACGLDNDWHGNPFPTTGLLLAMADETIKLKARCAICSEEASKTHKKTRQGDVVELGNGNLYEARCNRHWTLQD